MKSRTDYVREYAASHVHPVNQRIHLACVPAIFVATVALAWQVPVGFGLNLALVAVLPVLAFYARLGRDSLLTGSLWMGLSLLLCWGAQALGVSLLWPAAVTWIVAWAVQFYGHHLEGAKPSFADDLVFLLIGPLYVQEKWARALRA